MKTMAVTFKYERVIKRSRCSQWHLLRLCMCGRKLRGGLWCVCVGSEENIFEMLKTTSGGSGEMVKEKYCHDNYDANQ